MKKILISLLAISLAVISCNKAKENGATSISVSPTDIPADAGTYKIPYKIDNPKAGVNLTASADVDWIYNVKAEGGNISFEAATNFGESRVGNILINYEGLQETKASVFQSYKKFDAFDVNVTSITSYTCTAIITPNPANYAGNYHFIVLRKSFVDELLALETHSYGEMEFGEALFQNELEWLKNQAKDLNYTLEEYLPHNKSLYTVTSSGEPTEMPYGKVSRLSYNSDYYLVCFGMTTSGKRTTPMVLRQFKTADIQKVDMSFTMSTKNITSYTAEVTVTPSSKEHTYYWTYISEMDYAKVENDKYQVMSNMIKNIAAAASSSDRPISDFLVKGTVISPVENLWAGTKYYIFAWGMDSEGSPTTEPMEVGTFSTTELNLADDCTFDITVTEVQAQDIKIKVVPSKATTRYYVAIVLKSLTNGYTDEQFAQRAINSQSETFKREAIGENWSNSTSVYTGTQEKWTYSQTGWNWIIKPANDYCVFAFGVSEDGTRTTQVKKIETRSGDPTPSNMTITAEIGELKWNGADFTITPSNDEERYLQFLIRTSEIDNNGLRHSNGTLMDAAIMAQIEEYYSEDGPFEIDRHTYKGKHEFKHVKVLSDTKYSLLVCGYAGSNTTRFYETQFTTPKIPFEKGKGEIVMKKFEVFDGEDLYQLDNDKFKEHRDRSVLYVELEPNADAAHWYAGLWQPASHFEREGGWDYVIGLVQMENILGNNLYYPAKKGQFGPGWGGPYEENHPWTDENGHVCSTVPWCFYYYAEDADGNYGKNNYKYFITRKADYTIKDGDIYDMKPIKAYKFWETAGGKSFVLSAPKDGSQMPVELKFQ